MSYVLRYSWVKHVGVNIRKDMSLKEGLGKGKIKGYEKEGDRGVPY